MDKTYCIFEEVTNYSSCSRYKYVVKLVDRSACSDTALAAVCFSTNDKDLAYSTCRQLNEDVDEEWWTHLRDAEEYE